MQNYEKPLTAEEMAQLPDEEIDYTDIPELDEEFWKNARLVMPEASEDSPKTVQ